MWRLGIVLTVATLCLLFVSSVVLAFDDLIEPDIKYSSSKDGGSLSNMSLVMHNDQYIDANSILMFVSNTGNFARDIDALLIQPLQLWQGGLIYPYTGIADILNGTNDNTLVYAAGIWIGAIDASDDTLVTVAEFSSEYIPGPMSGGTFMPDALSNDAYRVYKLHSDSTGVNSNTDYDEWPTSQGAPLDGSLNPLLLGNQTLWTVFNDADASLHDNEAGTTAPLGIEVRQLVWAADSAGQDNAVFLDYRLYNKGAKSLYDVYVSFWFDPDIGEPWDDLTGCDTTCDRFFAFNGDAWDREYGAVPGALAGKLIQGPVVPSSGDTAAYFNDTIIGYKNLGMTSFHKLINITEPSHSRESYRYMAGLDADGDPLANGTKYQYPGNPITMTGDIDTDARECRILVTTGPIPSFLPGDSQQVIIKLSASGQHNWVYSLAKALYSVDTACSVTYPIFEPPDSVRPWLDQHMDVYFEPKDDRWLTGVEWGESQFFNGGADFGYNFFGSYLDPQVDIDSFPTIEVRFSNAVIQKAYSYLRGGPTPWDYNGYHTVPFTVWDIDNDRQLNVAFSEWYDGDIFDSTWNPDATAVGNREYLFFFNSDYAGNNPLNSTIPYTTMNIMGDGQSLDVLYSLWPKVETGHTFSELAAGHKLIFNVEDLRADGPGDTIYFRDTKVGSLSTKILDVRQYSGYHSMLRLDLSATGIFDLGQSVVGFSGVGTDKMSIIFVPATTDSYFEYFTITDTLTETVWRTVYLSGKGTYGGPVWYVSNSGDDVNNDGSESSPFAHIQHAVDMAGLHDTVLVEDGAYSGVGNREINFFGKNLVLISRNGSGYVTIDCEGVVAGFKFENGEDSTSVVQGIAVISGDDLYGGGADINGSSPRFLECDFEGNQGEEGAGVSCRNGSNAKFVDCQFIANIAYYSGGGVFVENSAPVFDGCMFIINQANDGGGIYVSHSSPRFDNCVIHHNEANSEGGGIMCYRSSAIFSNCTITSNTFTVGEGEAVYIDKNVDSTVVIENSIIAFNEGDAVLCHGTQGTLDISCTDIYGNTGSDWSGCIEGLGSLNGNLSIDPMFCDTTGGDYSISSSSPC
ncbi:MAG: right-handed parallel beta-helix repeat-containing protein, partial [candidate division Zixibacteria bacterium]|nr:right-handed parallel beta-helix repeat-containing protein [candidate division Zixibacteria bacterium]